MYFSGDEICNDISRKYTINSTSSGNLPYVFDGKDYVYLNKSQFLEMRSNYSLKCTYPNGQSATMILII